MNAEEIDQWLSIEQQREYIANLIGRVGLTRIRSEYFLRLWAYVLVKQKLELQPKLKPPLGELELPTGWIACTHREAAELFYSDKEKGSDRSAGMMLNILADLGLIEKQFDGNNINIKITFNPNLLVSKLSTESIALEIDDFNPNCDAIPVANFLARNYTWMNTNSNHMAHRIARILRKWAGQYPKGMRVLRCCDNGNPVGFYILYPTNSESEVSFFQPPSRSLHLGGLSDIKADPIKIAIPGDPDCTSVFVRSWIVDFDLPDRQKACVQFVQDVQQTLVAMRKDFPNLCDLYSMLIHPSYEALTQVLGFQKISQDPQLSIYWIYSAIDRFLALDLHKLL